MRRYFSLLCILALLVGCYNTDEQLINEPIPLEGRIFTASFEQNDTRTYVEEGNLLRWNAGDQVTIFDSNTLNQQYQFDGETGDNGGTFSKVSNSFGTGNDLNCHYAVYPYNKDIKITETGVITATLPAEQSYAENSFGLGANTMVAVTKDVDDTFLKFRNVGGYLKLQLYGDNVTVKSITLTGNNNEKIAGKVTITPAYGQSPTLAMSDDATTSITLDCGDGVKIGTTAETATAFWIVVPPTTFEEGLTITVTKIDGESFTKSTSNAVVVERNIIKPMAAFEVEIEKIPNNQIWYTSSDGNVVTPLETNAFGATIKSNNYENGKGIITFDNDVTVIGYQAFEGCSSLKSIKIPNSVTAIGDEAFRECASLEEITIPNNVSSIGVNAFLRCSSLVSITIPNNVSKIEKQTFYDCSSLISITIPNNVTTIGESAFNGCTSLTDITIPNSVKNISNWAFSDCTSLTSIILPNSVTAIEDYTFYNCTSLANITIPKTVTYIDYGAFLWCSSLTSIIIPNSVAFIGTSIFTGCTSLTSIIVEEGNSNYDSRDNCNAIIKTVSNTLISGCKNTIIPNSVTTIGKSAFYECSSLTEITIPNSVTSIETEAFYNCTSLANITIPKTVTYIEASTLSGCTSLTSIIVEEGNSVYDSRDNCNAIIETTSNTLISGCKNTIIPTNVTSIGNDAFMDCTSLTNITIPNSVTSIGSRAFLGCNFTSILIPDKVINIGQFAFAGCSSLTKVDVKPITPPAINNSFIGCSTSLKIYVPAGSLKAYKSADYWKDLNLLTE